MQALLSAKVKELTISDDTRLFVIGDVHGCYDKYIAGCNALGITDNDVVISVGDIIDRGPQSKELLDEFLTKPNRYMVLGNHEQMMVDAEADYLWANTWLRNGGLATIESMITPDISIEEENQILRHYRNLLRKIPLALLVKYRNKSIIVVHGETPYDFDLTNIDSSVKEMMLWGRTIIEHHDDFDKDSEAYKQLGCGNADYLVCGHTPQLEPLIINNRYYIDTGCCYPYRRSTPLRGLTFFTLKEDGSPDLITYYNRK